MKETLQFRMFHNSDIYRHSDVIMSSKESDAKTILYAVISNHMTKPIIGLSRLSIFTARCYASVVCAVIRPSVYPMGAGTFQKVVRLGLKNERSRREDRGAKGA